MEKTLPDVLQPLLADYLHALEPLQAHFYGIYIYGSIALGAFEESESDIDILALTRGEWLPRELKQLKLLHMQLIRAHALGRRMEVFYVPQNYPGVTHSDRKSGAFAPYPVMHDGIFSPATYGGLNAVTWWIIKNKGIRLLGPEVSELSLEVNWSDVLATMRFNLDVYFARKASRRPYTYLSDAGVEFAVSNLCRIFTTIEEGEIISKADSLKRWQDRLPERWRPLLAEAWRIRYHLDQPSCYRNRFQRMREMLAFIRYGRQRGAQALSHLSINS